MKFYKIAKNIVYQTNQLKTVDTSKEWNIPPDYPYDSLFFARTQLAYQLLDVHLQDIAFHAGEIYLINMTALLFCQMDFQKAMEFITNYGRDNDTIGAISGAILGAYWGAAQLPPHLVAQVLETNEEDLDIDLKSLAREFTDLVINRKGQIQ